MPQAASAAYSLTTVRQSTERMIEATVETLFAQIEGVVETTDLTLPVELVVRGSAPAAHRA